MDEKTKAALKAAGLEGLIATFDKLALDLKAAVDGRAADKEQFGKDLAAKDAIITQKTDDLVKQRQGYTKKLSEMTQAERDAMSEREIALQQGNEDLATRLEAFEKSQKETLQKEIDARRERAITKLVGTNPELRTKLTDAFKKIVDNDKAQTEEEIAAIATQAHNMIGAPKADPVREAINGGDGGAGPEVKPGEFAESKEGKELGAAMGLPVEPPPAAK